jgi:signal peptidase II
MTGTTVEAGTAARDRRIHWIVFFLLAAGIVIADQVLKSWVVASFRPGEITQILGDTIRIWFVQNTGALFGLFADQAAVFAALSIGVVALIVWYHGHAMRSYGWLATVALGLLFGGAIGNLLDRIRLGYVVDFVDMGIGNWRFYTYNVADSAITMSLALLILMALWPRRA